MKALKISLEHGKIWVGETSDGKRAQSATLRGCVEQLLPISTREFHPEDYDVIADLFDGIRDSGGSGGIARSGQVSG